MFYCNRIATIEKLTINKLTINSAIERVQCQAKEQREQWRKLAFRQCRVAIEFEELKLFEHCRA